MHLQKDNNKGYNQDCNSHQGQHPLWIIKSQRSMQDMELIAVQELRVPHVSASQ